MKKLFLMLMAAAMVGFGMTGCGKKEESKSAAASAASSDAGKSSSKKAVDRSSKEAVAKSLAQAMVNNDVDTAIACYKPGSVTAEDRDELRDECAEISEEHQSKIARLEKTLQQDLLSHHKVVQIKGKWYFVGSKEAEEEEKDSPKKSARRSSKKAADQSSKAAVANSLFQAMAHNDVETAIACCKPGSVDAEMRVQMKKEFSRYSAEYKKASAEDQAEEEVEMVSDLLKHEKFVQINGKWYVVPR